MKNFLNQISIILSHPTHPGNIGACARAMKNMGLANLCLVNPKDYPNDLAIRMSKGGKDVLENAKVVSSLDEAISDCNFVLGTSSRDNSVSWPMIELKEAIEKICLELKNPLSKIAILFGRESSGLSKEEIHKCNYQVVIPTSKEYQSLNLSQAVQIVCYELFQMMKVFDSINLYSNNYIHNNLYINNENDIYYEEQIKLKSKHANFKRYINKKNDSNYQSSINNSCDNNISFNNNGNINNKKYLNNHENNYGNITIDYASSSSLEKLYKELEQICIDIGYLDVNNPKNLMVHFRRIFNKAKLEQSELKILMGFIKSLKYD